MKVLLIGADSKLPNLALMKISAYHKAQGDTVGFNVPDPDRIYISRVFKEGKHTNPGIFYPGAEIIQGGPGYDVSVRLPPEIEATPPDQDLYDSKYSIARVTSGCPRRCHFCMVHKLEPKGVRYLMPPSVQWKPETILRLLDDNILAMPKAFWEVHELSVKKKAKIHFEYLDIRLVTPKIAKGLREIKHKDYIHFAYDYTEIEKAVRRGVNHLIVAGIPTSRLMFLIYCEDESTLEDTKYRFNLIRELGALPFLLVNKENLTPALIRIRRKADNLYRQRKLTTDQIFNPETTSDDEVFK